MAQAGAEWTALERMADEIERAALQGEKVPYYMCSLIQLPIQTSI